MEFRFVPTKLIKAKEDIIAKHAEIGDTLQVSNDFKFMNLIKRLVSLSKTEAEAEALVLTKKELELIVKYLPHNYYKVQMDNLFLIYRIRCNLKLSWLLFYEWQNAYDNLEFNDFLKSYMVESDDYEKIMITNHFTVQKFVECLSEEIIPIAYGKAALTVDKIHADTFSDKLEYIGIKKTSRLSEDSEHLFYVFCSKNDYLAVGEQELLISIRRYNDKISKIFLKNFLQELSLLQLKNFNRIAEYFLGITGENHSEKFNSYFANFGSVIIRKYVDWINIYKINKIFGDDERSLFWEQYHHEQVTKYSYSNSVVMEFNDYVAIEFLGQAMGPLYIYKKKYFENEVRKLLKMRMYDNTGLRGYLLNHTDYTKNAKILRNINGTRLVHLPNPGWQINFRSVLINNGITERIL